MAKQKEDYLTFEMSGLGNPVGRPKGSKPPMTAAEKMRAYRERKKNKGIKTIELSYQEQMLLWRALQDYGKSEAWKEEELKSQLLKRLEF